MAAMRAKTPLNRVLLMGYSFIGGKGGKCPLLIMVQRWYNIKRKGLQ